MQEGDVVLLQYESKVSKGRYRLARIVKVHPDRSGVVRTVTVQLRPKLAKEKATPYKAKKMTEFPVAVQRLVVIVPREEQPSHGLHCDAQDYQDGSDIGGAIIPEPDDFGSAATDTRERAQRRSHSGALPLNVPEWLPDVLQESQEDVQSVIPYEGE